MQDFACLKLLGYNKMLTFLLKGRNIKSAPAFSGPVLFYNQVCAFILKSLQEVDCSYCIL